MYRISVQIVRFVDDGFPGWVECELVDADGHRHVLRDKFPVFTSETLDAYSQYPKPGTVECEVLDRFRDEKGRELVRVNTQGVESTEGICEFTLPANRIASSA